jgi:phospholipid-binding lipoprotein MlaA|tara:strand:- start:442 stop:1203 length:762 start_codon:yes stop_codon:yes gene_type:complete
MKKIIIITLLAITVAFSANAENNGPENVKDCSETFNRASFKFNQGLDRAIVRPLAVGYRKLPNGIRTVTSNFLNNLSNLVTIPNNALQGELGKAGNNLARLGINSTVGILGLFDVATAMGFEEYEKEDYGQTLGKLGNGPGCYLVLPILGPSTARDTFGTVIGMFGGDPWYNVTVKNDTRHFKDSDFYISRATNGVDFRAKNLNALDNLEENSMDFYASVKSLYLQDRQQKILNSKKSTESQDDSDWDDVSTD